MSIHEFGPLEMEGLVAFGTALGLIALLELGDKTQMLTISLAARRPWAPVLGGAATGLIAGLLGLITSIIGTAYWFASS